MSRNRYLRYEREMLRSLLFEQLGGFVRIQAFCLEMLCRGILFPRCVFFYTVVTVFPSCSSNFTREGCRIARKLRSISIGVLFLKATLFVIILRQGQDYFRLSKFSLAPFTCTRTCIHCLTADCLQLCSFMDVNSWLPCHSQ